MKIRVGILTAPKIEFERRENTFLLRNVRIGIGFHWDRYEDQEFAGTLEIRRNPDGTETAINTIDLEDYLCSVISSEMSADSPMELLKAHAVISRSWAMRAIAQRPHEQMVNGQMVNDFDVCADDHCQRYEGLRRQNERAVMAVRATAGQVLVYVQSDKGQGTKEEICDCRYHKCCGGRTEIWRTCWEDRDVPYIQSVECDWCNPNGKWKMENGKCLNDYDQETTDFHDWQVRYTQEELSDIIRRKSGIDFGDIIDLVPVHRGASGRIDLLKIVGTKRTETIGKELKIRQWLSPTCLYSSWFDVEKNSQLSTLNFKLIGRGWGHGAGLCQIGAAVMAAEGKTYEEILSHYYRNTQLKIEN
ncbi:MAG: SpoIID/LytB domain-containing protein [Paludibacteraceae bacterium]|nr:SpoIID/LytB domain-containing protein [Paludibacteraceae bacterium]